MPILNYTTSIASEKTVMEIQQKLAKAKAQAVLSEYDDNGILASLSFKMRWGDKFISYKLPANIENVYKCLQRNHKVPSRLRTYEQASKVAWRIIKDWIEAQLAIVEAEMVEMNEVFLPYAITKNNKTVYEEIGENKTGLLLEYEQ